MTSSAWLMLGITWAVIAFFTVRFFIKVLRTPPRPAGEDTR
jgi:hypothetical protein